MLPYRNPLLLAKAAATVDKLSGGRFILGVGAGYLKGEFNALGVDFDERNELFDEALDVLPLHWSGEPFSYEGTPLRSARVRSAARARCRTRSRSGSAATPSVTRAASPSGRRAGCRCSIAPEYAATTRTPPLSGIDAVAAKIAELRDAAAARGIELNVVYPYTDAGLADSRPRVRPPPRSLRRPRSRGRDLGDGVGPNPRRAGTLDFLGRFGAHLSHGLRAASTFATVPAIGFSDSEGCPKTRGHDLRAAPYGVHDVGEVPGPRGTRRRRVDDGSFYTPSSLAVDVGGGRRHAGEGTVSVHVACSSPRVPSSACAPTTRCYRLPLDPRLVEASASGRSLREGVRAFDRPQRKLRDPRTRATTMRQRTSFHRHEVPQTSVRHCSSFSPGFDSTLGRLHRDGRGSAPTGLPRLRARRARSGSAP